MLSPHNPSAGRLRADDFRTLPERDLVEGPIGRTLLLFALPIMGSTILQSLNGSINAVWIGRFLGEEALAASANGNLLIFLLTAFGFGLTMASTVLIGQAMGRSDADGARRIIGTALGAFLVFVGAMTAIGWILAPHVLQLLAIPEGAFASGLGYLKAMLLSLPPAMLMTMIMQSLRGAGDAMTPLWFLILSAVLDCLLNPVLILGLGPAPELGIVGSGIATTIANIVSLVGLIAYGYACNLSLRLRGTELAYLWPDPLLLGRMIRIGIPVGLTMIVTASSALVMLGLINRTGIVVTAAYSAMQQLWTYVQMPALSLGAASSAMVAQNIGAGRWDRVGKITRAALWFNLLLTNLLIVLVTVVEVEALGLFLGGDSPALEAGVHIHRLATWGYFFSGVSLVLFGVVRGNGAVIWPLIILIVTMYPLRIGFAVLAQPWIGQDALWLSFPISSVAGAGMAALLYLRSDWRARRLTSPARPQDYIDEALAAGEPGGSLQPRG